MNAVVYVNGTISDARDAVVPVFDHGFLYGEGIYETLRTYRREPFLFDRHVRRLRTSAALMALPVPFSDNDLLSHVRETMKAHLVAAGPAPARPLENAEGGEFYIRVLLTRGVGELTYQPDACITPTLVIIVKPLGVAPAHQFTDGIRLALVSIRRNHPHALNPMIKSNNLLNNALAMQEALRHGADEALMLNLDGELSECSQSNVFLVKNGVALTPPLSAGLLPGITREFVLELAHELNIGAREARLTPDDVWSADEAFLTGTTREVTPVAMVDGRPIGSGRPGPVTRRLLEAFRQRIHEPSPVR
jgi:branched-chain amino acid aminotransferase